MNEVKSDVFKSPEEVGYDYFVTLGRNVSHYLGSKYSVGEVVGWIRSFFEPYMEHKIAKRDYSLSMPSFIEINLAFDFRKEFQNISGFTEFSQIQYAFLEYLYFVDHMEGELKPHREAWIKGFKFETGLDLIEQWGIFRPMIFSNFDSKGAVYMSQETCDQLKKSVESVCDTAHKVESKLAKAVYNPKALSATFRSELVNCVMKHESLSDLNNVRIGCRTIPRGFVVDIIESDDRADTIAYRWCNEFAFEGISGEEQYRVNHILLDYISRIRKLAREIESKELKVPSTGNDSVNLVDDKSLESEYRRGLEKGLSLFLDKNSFEDYQAEFLRWISLNKGGVIPDRQMFDYVRKMIISDTFYERLHAFISYKSGDPTEPNRYAQFPFSPYFNEYAVGGVKNLLVELLKGDFYSITGGIEKGCIVLQGNYGELFMFYDGREVIAGFFTGAFDGSAESPKDVKSAEGIAKVV